MMAADGLLPQTVRGRAGHVHFPRNYFPRNEIPSWAECVDLLRERRDRRLRRAASALRRLETEVEAVRYDFTEAREYPQQTLGIDLMSFGHWPYDRMACVDNPSSPVSWSSSPPNAGPWGGRLEVVP